MPVYSMVTIETNSSQPLRCYLCQTDIPISALQVVKHTARFGVQVCHLACWRPVTAIPFKRAWFRFGDAEARARKSEVQKWVDSWNKQFEPSEVLVPPVFLNKAVSTASTPLRRLLLEVCIYLSTGDVESKVAVVCKDWLHVSRDEEFWRTRFVAEFHPSVTEAEGDYRRKYIAYQLSSCWHCKAFKPIAEIEFRCSLFHRPLCKLCAAQTLCHITSFHIYRLSHWVSQSVLDSLSIPSFPHDRNAKSTYMLLYQSKLQPYAETRRHLLLRTIDTCYSGLLRPEDRTAVEHFDLGQFYGQGFGAPISLVEMALMKFCGKGGRREDVNASVEEFLRDMKPT